MLTAPLLLLALTVLPAQAGPAPWFLWESLAGPQRFCAQTSPGSGWRKLSGPYRNAACRAAPVPTR